MCLFLSFGLFLSVSRFEGRRNAYSCELIFAEIACNFVQGKGAWREWMNHRQEDRAAVRFTAMPSDTLFDFNCGNVG